MRTKRYFFFWLVCFGIAGLLVACGGEAEETPAPTAVSETLPPTSTATPAATNTPTPTATPSPTPIPPLLEVDDQILGPDGLLRLTAVQSPVDGIVAIYRASGQELGEGDLLGYTAVDAGETSDLTVAIEPADLSSLSDTLQVALHAAPSADEDDFDPAVDDLLLITQFQIENQAIEPIIEISQEVVTTNGLLLVERVVMPDDGWLALYNNNNDDNDDDDEWDTLIAFVPLTAGENEQIPLYLRWHDAHNNLVAVLYRDNGEEPGRFEATDSPLMFAGVPATQEITVRLPAQITSLDQPVVNGRVIVPRVVSDGPGFVVVYQSEENGQPGFIIGSLYVPDGVSTSVAVSVTQAAVTPQMMLKLHMDGNDNQTFNFPGPDEPQLSSGQQFFVPFNTDVGTYLITADQTLGADNQVMVPLVAAEQAVWVVIRAPNEANTAVAGAILGQTRLPAGVSQNVIIELGDTPVTATTLFAMLYQSNDPQDSFDPTTDVPLIRRSEPLSATFSVE